MRAGKSKRQIPTLMKHYKTAILTVKIKKKKIPKKNKTLWKKKLTVHGNRQVRNIGFKLEKFQKI